MVSWGLPQLLNLLRECRPLQSWLHNGSRHNLNFIVFSVFAISPSILLQQQTALPAPSTILQHSSSSWESGEGPDKMCLNPRLETPDPFVQPPREPTKHCGMHWDITLKLLTHESNARGKRMSAKEGSVGYSRSCELKQVVVRPIKRAMWLRPSEVQPIYLSNMGRVEFPRRHGPETSGNH